MKFSEPLFQLKRWKIFQQWWLKQPQCFGNPATTSFWLLGTEQTSACLLYPKNQCWQMNTGHFNKVVHILDRCDFSHKAPYSWNDRHFSRAAFCRGKITCDPSKREVKNILSSERNPPLSSATQPGNPTPGGKKRRLSTHETIREHAASVHLSSQRFWRYWPSFDAHEYPETPLTSDSGHFTIRCCPGTTLLNPGQLCQ